MNAKQTENPSIFKLLLKILRVLSSALAQCFPVFPEAF